VAGDHTLADPHPFGDLSQRRLRVAEGGDGVDPALDDLHSPRFLDE
jgi:hypothetical protein